MRRERLFSIGLIIGIALTWSLFLALVIWGILGGEQRTRDLGALALERVLVAQRAHLTMAMQGIEQDLQEEVAYISRIDSLDEDALAERWIPLLNGDWRITSIAVATEDGDMLALYRQEGRWQMVNAVKGSGSGPPLITEWPMLQDSARKRTYIGASMIDPRREAWFGQALENHDPAPAWSITLRADSTDELNTAMLMRAVRAGLPYSILRFTIDPSTLTTSLATPSPERTVLFMNAMGKCWPKLDGSFKAELNIAQALWKSDHSAGPILLSVDGSDQMASMVPFARNGTLIHIGAAVRMDRIAQWTRKERLALWTALALLILLGALLGSAFVRGRSRDRRVERQEKRSLTQERKLAKALSEREILDREVHHRVKNNLQVVSSLLNLQAERVPDREARREFARGKRRIDSMALVHHKLYMQQDLRAIDMQLFLTQVAGAAHAMHEPESRAVSHTVEALNIKADADTAIQVGLILCELLSNCYQHAFPYVTGGHIDISIVAADAERYELLVKDNGRGLDRDPATREGELGLELVEALADQIDGHMTVASADGTVVKVTFRMQGYAGMKTV